MKYTKLLWALPALPIGLLMLSAHKQAEINADPAFNKMKAAWMSAASKRGDLLAGTEVSISGTTLSDEDMTGPNGDRKNVAIIIKGKGDAIGELQYNSTNAIDIATQAPDFVEAKPPFHLNSDQSILRCVAYGLQQFLTETKWKPDQPLKVSIQQRNPSYSLDGKPENTDGLFSIKVDGENFGGLSYEGKSCGGFGIAPEHWTFDAQNNSPRDAYALLKTLKLGISALSGQMQAPKMSKGEFIPPP
jgi:hypothetical protein